MVPANVFRGEQVPVTVRLSKLFHEHFGDEIADEIVNWFNTLDVNSRSDLREINELNFARFDAKVEQRFAEQDARIEKRLAELEVRIEKRFSEQDGKFADLRDSLQQAMKDQGRWIIVMWSAFMIPLIGLSLRQ